MNTFEALKKLFIKILIGSLIAAAAIAVAAVLVGSFNDILSRALYTLVIVAFHALVSLAYIQSNEKRQEAQELGFFSNAVFLIIILSFITSIFGVWNVFDSSLVEKLYQAYFIILFGVLHVELLYKSTGLEVRIDRLVLANFVFIAIVLVQLLLVISFDSGSFNGLYYRILSAAAIVDTTLTILVVILQKLYLSKHPEMQSALFTNVGVGAATGQLGAVQPARRRTNPLLLALGLFIAFQFIGAILFLVSILSSKFS